MALVAAAEVARLAVTVAANGKAVVAPAAAAAAAQSLFGQNSAFDRLDYTM
jgi:hypothetical protein